MLVLRQADFRVVFSKLVEQNPDILELESEAGFRVLFECATISILVINAQGNIELENPCAETLFGYQPAELIGQPVEVLIRRAEVSL